MAEPYDENIEAPTEANPQQAPVIHSRLGLTRPLFESRGDPNAPPNWLPACLHPVFLVVFTTISGLLIVAVEVLFWASYHNVGPYSEGHFYFRSLVGQFFGLFVTVVFGQFYVALDLIVKDMEPFYHLSNGAEAAKCMTIDYFHTLIYFAPFKAIYHRHWAVVCSSLASLISTNILPMMAVGIFGLHYDTNPMHPTYTHIFSAFAGVMAMLTVTLHVIISRRKSGLLQYPEELDAMIDMSTNLHGDNSLYTYFRQHGLKDKIDGKELARMLEGSKFRSCRRGLEAPINILYDGPHDSPKPGLTRRMSSKVERWFEKILGCVRSEKHPACFQTIPLVAIIVALLTLFILANGQPPWATKHKFFDYIGSERFDRSGIANVVNTGIFLQIEKNARLMEPFYQLTRLGGAPREVINLNNDWPFQDLYNCLKAFRKWPKKRVTDTAMFFITLGSYASALFVVTWNTLAFTDYQTPGSGYWIVLGLQIGTEVIMLLALLAIFLFRRRPILPRMPVTVASKLVFVYATNVPSIRYSKYQEWGQELPESSVHQESSHESPHLPENECQRTQTRLDPPQPNVQSSSATAVNEPETPSPQAKAAEQDDSSPNLGFGSFTGRDGNEYFGICLADSRKEI